MICPVDESGWCSRHQGRHTGRILELSQLDTPQGEAHRALWDERLLARARREPSLLTRAGRFLHAVLLHEATGRQELPLRKIALRLAVCRACHFLKPSGKGCTQCGCTNLLAKASWPEQDCPLGKWPS